MARYVIANRRAGKFRAEAKLVSRSAMTIALDRLPGIEILQDTDPLDPLARRVTVVEADPVEMVARAALLPPDIIVEPEILHWPDAVPPRDFLPARLGLAAPLDIAAARAIAVTATGGGTPLPNADVKLYLRGLGGSMELKGRTDEAGVCCFQVAAGYVAAAALVIPAGAHWPTVARGVGVASPIECPPLPTDGPLGWWHRVLGVEEFDLAAGGGIRVGVADTGLGPHANLAHAVLVGAFVGGEILKPEQSVDVGAHGSHVSGTIGARPATPGEYGGIAPGCDLFAARIFADAEGGASNADIANAIDALSRDHTVDLINLSLGATTPSQVVHDAIIDASERGTLCVCAAGNDAAAVNYPAAFPEAFAVAALGLAGWGPPGSLSASRLPLEPELFGRQHLFAANFTSHGREVVAAGPGVGILATVPNHFGAAPLYGAMDGTSMASPVVCGALATVLARSSAYRALPRDSSRTRAARDLFSAILRDVGLPPTYQGRGLPSAGQMLA